ncbi:MAG: hypothetical protein RLZZ76_5 [Candidatus Parcubacteria bacterium]|jgi:hypothetical protein
MFGSERVFRRPAEEALARSRGAQSAEEIIRSQEDRAMLAKDNEFLTAPLRGENAFSKILAGKDEEEKIDIASRIIDSIPFIKKQIPDHLETGNEQAAFIVAVAKVLEESERSKH